LRWFVLGYVGLDSLMVGCD